jgi:hypothetical protein
MASSTIVLGRQVGIYVLDAMRRDLELYTSTMVSHAALFDTKYTAIVHSPKLKV